MLRVTDTRRLMVGFLSASIDRRDVSGLVVRGVEVAIQLDRGCAGGVDMQASGADSDSWVVGVSHRVHREVEVVVSLLEHVAELGGRLGEGGDGICELGKDDINIGGGQARSVDGDPGETSDGVLRLAGAVQDLGAVPAPFGVVVHRHHRRADGMRRSADSSSSSRRRMERRPHW